MPPIDKLIEVAAQRSDEAMRAWRELSDQCADAMRKLALLKEYRERYRGRMADGLAGAGDMKAFEQLVERHQRLVVGTVGRMLGTSSDAEDIAQQVFVRVWKNVKRYEPRAIAPGHGRVLTDPARAIDGIVAHRGRREAKVLAVLGAAARGDIDELLPEVYDDVRPELLPIARYSLEAHLIKLEREGRAAREQGVWSLRADRAGGEQAGGE